MKKHISIAASLDKIKEGATLMVGGFLSNGSPCRILEKLAEKGTKHLTIICNDTAYADKGVGLLIAGGQVDKVIVSHIGTNPITIEKMNNGEIQVEFVPQGTLAERIRAAGAGLGGVLTTTGMGTVIEQGKQTVTVNGKKFLLEEPLKADVAIIGASICDKSGNLIYKGTTQNFNPIMATAADTVIVEAQQIVENGSLAPESIHTPNIFVDYIVTAEN